MAHIISYTHTHGCIKIHRNEISCYDKLSMVRRHEHPDTVDYLFYYKYSIPNLLIKYSFIYRIFFNSLSQVLKLTILQVLLQNLCQIQMLIMIEFEGKLAI